MLTLYDMCVVVLIHSADQTAPTGYKWISSGMEDEHCLGINCELMHEYHHS